MYKAFRLTFTVCVSFNKYLSKLILFLRIAPKLSKKNQHFSILWNTPLNVHQLHSNYLFSLIASNNFKRNYCRPVSRHYTEWHLQKNATFTRHIPIQTLRVRVCVYSHANPIKSKQFNCIVITAVFEIVTAWLDSTNLVDRQRLIYKNYRHSQDSQAYRVED